MHDRDVQALAARLPYTVAAAKNGDAWVDIAGTPRSPQEISAHVLAKMKRVAEDYLGEPVFEAVVTVPAYFDDRPAPGDQGSAGAIAGLTVRAILNEPTAAALAYGAQHQHNQRLAVFDLGGGTFDISILAIEERRCSRLLATHGDTSLGGDDFDRVIIDLLVEEFLAEHGINLRNDSVALQRLKEAAERAKIELSSAMTTDVNLPFIRGRRQGPGPPDARARARPARTRVAAASSIGSTPRVTSASRTRIARPPTSIRSCSSAA